MNRLKALYRGWGIACGDRTGGTLRHRFRIYRAEDGSVLYSPLLPVHITAGILGILSGSAAMSFRKGSSRHVLAGRVFVVSMLTMATAAVYLAVHKHQTPNILAGALTFYLITTSLVDGTTQAYGNQCTRLGITFNPFGRRLMGVDRWFGKNL